MWCVHVAHESLRDDKIVHLPTGGETGHMNQTRRKLTHTGVTVATPGCTTRDDEFVETCMSGSCDLFHHL